jgi:peptidyl-prolyl cis-trans isomerase B (cyclophilin B)
MKHAYFHTNKGQFIVALDDEKAPATVKNFLDYVHAKHYDGTIFHRVINGFMIQGGGFEPSMKQKATKEPIRNEAQNGLKNDEYTIAMARTNDPHSATAQFFINVNRNDFLNHSLPTPQGWGYTVFGKVVNGQSTIEAIRQVKTGNKGFHQDVPLEDVVIEWVQEWDMEAGRPAGWTEHETQGEPAAQVEIRETFFAKGTQIVTHEVAGAASNLTITVGDEPNEKTHANHRYDITGFNTATNPSERIESAALELSILFQHGPIPEFGNNGITIESLLAICAHRLEGFQAGPFACDENSRALDHVNMALAALKGRTKTRVAKGVEGTEQKH